MDLREGERESGRVGEEDKKQPLPISHSPAPPLSNPCSLNSLAIRRRALRSTPSSFHLYGLWWRSMADRCGSRFHIVRPYRSAPRASSSPQKSWRRPADEALSFYGP